jgi:predicted dehydrogenase
MPGRSVRYAVVGLGHIAEVAVLPAFAHARANSELAAVVSGDSEKRATAERRYDGVKAYAYEQYARCLETVDAVYIALPNFLHAEYSVRAAEAGVHVLCEKPLAVTAEECERMIAACDAHQVRLMVAYRLHFEPLTLDAIEVVRSGRIGEPRFFTSAFSFHVRSENVRGLGFSKGGGTLYDIGVYCINAARNLFRSEPTEVAALSVNSGGAHLSAIDATTAAILRFGNDRVASFVTSFDAKGVSSYHIVGTQGDLRVDPAYEYAHGLAYELTIDGKTERKTLGRHEQFAGQLLAFSEYVLTGREPEPSGVEGMQDVRIIEALLESTKNGRAIQIPEMPADRYPTAVQRLVRPPASRPPLVNAERASSG